MPVNYASRYSNIVDERFKAASMTQTATNDNFDFVGVRTVNVYSVSTSPMNDYTMSGANRYGIPAELENTTQELTLNQDRSFTFTIDRRNNIDTMMVMEGGRALRRQLDEVVTPEIDTYTLATIAAGAGNTVTAAITRTNAYEAFLDGVTTLKRAKAPLAGTVAFINSNFYKQIRLDDSFIQASDIAQNMLVSGQVGAIENIPLVFADIGIMPAGVEFMLSNRIAVTRPMKIGEYFVHENPPGISGQLVEGRFYYDCFVLNNKKNVIYVHKGV